MVNRVPANVAPLKRIYLARVPRMVAICANSGHWPTAWRTGQLAPLLPFKVGPMNGPKGRESGL
jgi:hypothetical protein